MSKWKCDKRGCDIDPQYLYGSKPYDQINLKWYCRECFIDKFGEANFPSDEEFELDDGVNDED